MRSRHLVFSFSILLAGLVACGPTDPSQVKSNTDDGPDMGQNMPDEGMPPVTGCEETEADETTCDGEDNDCDGVSDEGCACDFEETTRGVCVRGAIDAASGMCASPAEYEADESTCDGEDNDCDGVVDEGCACDYEQLDKGVCADGSIGADGVCAAPSAYEAPETSCDGLDNDCDGVVDGGCACDFDGSSEGVCAGSAIDPMTGMCAQPGNYAADESACDDLDNDCDGVVDEGCACNFKDETRGVCAGSVRGATDGACIEPAAYEADETTCDGEDNDCDGATDEGCGCPFMGSMLGVCGAGVLNPMTNACDAPANFEMDESSCDGQDNDCDGVVDEGCACDFDGKVAGVCAMGSVNPADGACQSPSDYQASESACDMLDNDCDGVVDEGCACNFNNSAAGVCAMGSVEEGSGNCKAPVTYQSIENACDGLDNNCDGFVDEGCSCQFMGDMDGVCGAARLDAMATCAQPAEYEADESLCDMLDNDCDGAVDEGCPRAPVYGDLVITEIMQNPKVVTDTNGEWFEITNTASDPIELKGLVFSDNTPTGRLTVGVSHILAPGDFFVFGRKADMAINGGIVVDYAQEEFLLNNDGDALKILRNMNGSLVPIDQVVYDAMWPLGNGASLQLKGSMIDATQNDSSSAWCASSNDIGPGQDKGTPGAASDCP